MTENLLEAMTKVTVFERAREDTKKHYTAWYIPLQ